MKKTREETRLKKKKNLSQKIFDKEKIPTFLLSFFLLSLVFSYYCAEE